VLVIGLMLIAAGILGPRVRGRVSLEFGMGGATLDVQLHIAPPGQVGRLPRRGAAAAAAVAADPVPPAVRAAEAVAAIVGAHSTANGNGNGHDHTPAAGTDQPAAESDRT
jgi:hypothetical protein